MTHFGYPEPNSFSLDSKFEKYYATHEVVYHGSYWELWFCGMKKNVQKYVCVPSRNFLSPAFSVKGDKETRWKICILVGEYGDSKFVRVQLDVTNKSKDMMLFVYAKAVPVYDKSKPFTEMEVPLNCVVDQLWQKIELPYLTLQYGARHNILISILYFKLPSTVKIVSHPNGVITGTPDEFLQKFISSGCHFGNSFRTFRSFVVSQKLIVYKYEEAKRLEALHFESENLFFREAQFSIHTNKFFPTVRWKYIPSIGFTAYEDGDFIWNVYVTRFPRDRNKFRVSLDLSSSFTDANLMIYAQMKEVPDLELPFEEEVYLPFRFLSTEYLVNFLAVTLSENFKEFRIDVVFALAPNFLKLTDLLVKPYSPFRTKKCTTTDLLMCQELAPFLHDPRFSDVILRCDGQEWKLHKSLLSARSVVFAAMFSCNMKESMTNVVEIEDATCNSLDIMIQYVYGDEVSLNGSEEEVLYLAEKYDMSELKHLCELKLISCLDIDRCLYYLMLADSFNALFLTKSAMQFAVCNFAAISSSNEYHDFSKEYQTLSAEIVRQYYSVKKK